MNKKIIVIIGSIIILLGGGIFFLMKQKSYVPSEAIHAVPRDASIIIESHHFEDLLKALSAKNHLWREIQSIQAFSNVQEQINLLDTIISKHPFLKANLKKNPVLISLHSNGKNRIDPCFYHSIQGRSSNNKILNAARQELGDDTKIKEKQYEGTVIYHFNINNKPYYFSYHQGILIASPSAILIENAIRQVNIRSSITQLAGFRQVMKTANSNYEANLFIQHRKLPDLLHVLAPEKYSKGIELLSRSGSWSELDIRVKSDIILCGGFSTSSDSANQYLSLFKKQSPKGVDIDRIFPSNTFFFIHFNLSDPTLFLKEYNAYLKEHQELNAYEQNIQKIKDTYQFDLKDFFQKHAQGGITLCFSDHKNKSLQENTYSVLQVQSGQSAEKDLTELVKKAAENKKHKKRHMIDEYKVDNETTYTIFKLPFTHFINKITGGPFQASSDKYCAIIENYLVFADNSKILKEIIHFNLTRKTLMTNYNYRDISKYLSLKSNLFIYLNNARAQMLWKNYLNKKYYDYYSSNIQEFQKMQGMALEISSEGEMLYNNLFIKYTPEIKREAQTYWESLLDTNINHKPAFVDNHYTNEKEIFVQDQKNNIYLINKIGRILWKVKIKEQINSEIFQIDYYKNGKLQLFFSTPNYLHLIDRNGNYVEKYPIRLRSKASNGVNVFDYEHNKDYRMMIATQNKKVYNYEKDGSLIKGWQFDQTETPVTQPIQHFRSDKKDYIVFSDQYRIYILNRQGKTRIAPENHFTSSKNNHFFFDENNQHFLTTDTNGTIHTINTAGQVESIQPDQFSAKHFFIYKDASADGNKDYIFADKNKLIIYDQRKNIVCSHQFNSAISSHPIYFDFGKKDHKLGIVTKDNNQIYLIKQDGSIHKDFPLNGNTPFSINRFEKNISKFNLIVGSKNNFLYNYTLH